VPFTIRDRIIFFNGSLIIARLFKDQDIFFFYHTKITIFPFKPTKNSNLSVIYSFVFSFKLHSKITAITLKEKKMPNKCFGVLCLFHFVTSLFVPLFFVRLSQSHVLDNIVVELTWINSCIFFYIFFRICFFNLINLH